MQVLQQIGMAAHDQLPVVGGAAGPAGDAGGDDFLRQLVEFGAVLRQGGFEFEPRLGQGATANPRIQEVRRLGQA